MLAIHTGIDCYAPPTVC